MTILIVALYSAWDPRGKPAVVEKSKKNRHRSLWENEKRSIGGGRGFSTKRFGPEITPIQNSAIGSFFMPTSSFCRHLRYTFMAVIWHQDLRRKSMKHSFLFHFLLPMACNRLARSRPKSLRLEA
jgi:hypothetical protein